MCGIVMFCLTACVSKQINVYDTMANTELCTLIINGTLRVTSFNGKKVKWDAGFFGYGQGASKTTIQIPAGTNNFTVDYKEWYGANMYYGLKNIKITSHFEAGKTYEMDQMNRGMVYLQQKE
jgi:hypothetical protein